MNELKTGLSAVCHLRVTDANVVASMQFVTGFDVRTVVVLVVEHSEVWEHEKLQGLARYLTCFKETPQLKGMK